MYVNYFSISANTIMREAERNEMSLKNSAVDRFARNTDLRYDERTNRTCVRQLRDALGNKRLKQKVVRQDAKWLIKCLTDIFPDKQQVAAPLEPKGMMIELTKENVAKIADGAVAAYQALSIQEEVLHSTQEGQDEAVAEVVGLPAVPELPAPLTA
jgi:hypothetical protein